MTTIDHLVVTAGALSDGIAWVESNLGVAPEPGGEHPKMGTHNALVRLGSALYLEVIAPNPGVPAPPRPRWFELDRPRVDGSPRLATWVARTDDIRAATARCDGHRFGEVEPMSRGRFRWEITVPRDGSLIAGGLIPMLIHWQDEKHPAGGLADHRLRLLEFELFTADAERVSEVIDCLGLGPEVVVHKLHSDELPHLVATIDTPEGPRSLGGPR